MPRPIDVFLSYASEDELMAHELEKHLSSLIREGLIRPWSQRRIGAGEEWRAVVDRNLESARLILLLVSKDYLASDYCHDVEMRCALDRHHRGLSRVIPIILHPVDWRGSKFDLMGLAVLPEGGRPVSHRNWGSRDSAWTVVTSGIRAAIAQLQGAAPATPRAMGESYVRPTGAVAASTPIAGAAPPGPSYVRVAAVSAPVVEAPRRVRPEKASRSWVRWILVGCVVVPLALFAAVALESWVTRAPRLSGVPPTYDPPRSTPSPTPPVQSCGAPCCGGSECPAIAQDTRGSTCAARPGHCSQCTSGRTCVVGACGEDLPHASAWSLRLAHVIVPGAADDMNVCVKRARDPQTAWVCTRVGDAADVTNAAPGAASRSRLSVTTSDLLHGGGIDILVGRPGLPVIASATGATVSTNLKRSALCIGVDVRIAGGSVRFYLDDP